MTWPEAIVYIVAIIAGAAVWIALIVGDTIEFRRLGLGRPPQNRRRDTDAEERDHQDR